MHHIDKHQRYVFALGLAECLVHGKSNLKVNRTWVWKGTGRILQVVVFAESATCIINMDGR